MNIDKIRLFAQQHAIESEDFAITFRSPLDEGDESRFVDSQEKIGKFFGAIDDINVLQFGVGDNPPPKPIAKQLAEFGRNGKPDWIGRFENNSISVSSKQYTSWLEIWPKAKDRLSVLLQSVDEHKLLNSIEYAVTDTLIESVEDGNEAIQLLSKNIFKQSELVPSMLNGFGDPRWDFQQGFFHRKGEHGEILERLEAKSILNNGNIVVSIVSKLSLRLSGVYRVRDVFDGAELIGIGVDYFDNFHDLNKKTIKDVLIETLLERMGLS